jgi:hypothetical protein
VSEKNYKKYANICMKLSEFRILSRVIEREEEPLGKIMVFKSYY